jgi:ATP-dependent Clp protease ATP-binding subunit ClpX
MAQPAGSALAFAVLVIIVCGMKLSSEKIPDPRELEKEIGQFLSKKFGTHVKVASPIMMAQEAVQEGEAAAPPEKEKKELVFDLRPEELVAYLDQYIVKQEAAKAILATKICTHFNRIQHQKASEEKVPEMVGQIKNNVLMLGPTGVGKTYMVKLIANRIGVPFVKGDATKFSETGYVGGDVEDLVRDLVREADGDIERAQYGIIYIDEIDKIASSRNMIGADVSRTGVQRALLKPMEETEVDLKVPHDPISMMQELERFRKTGQRDRSSVNTRNILFIMSGAFGDLGDIIRRRINDQPIGFGSNPDHVKDPATLLRQIRSEDLTAYGFESEFVGRLPVRAVLEHLTEDDLLEILSSPNNPIVLGKKLDFAAYGIDICFERKALALLARRAFDENTGARGLVSAVENALILFEKRLPSTEIKHFPIDAAAIEAPEAVLDTLMALPARELADRFIELKNQEKRAITRYLEENRELLSNRHSFTLTPERMKIAAAYYSRHVMDIGTVLDRINFFYDEIKKLELYFFKNHDINIVLENSAVDHIMDQFVTASVDLDRFYKKLALEFEHGLRLIKEKTGDNRFFLSKEALLDPERYIASQLMLKRSMSDTDSATEQDQNISGKAPDDSPRLTT